MVIYAAAAFIAWAAAGLLAWAMVYKPKPWAIHYTDKTTGAQSVAGYYATKAEAEQAIAELSAVMPRFVLEPTRRNA